MQEARSKVLGVGQAPAGLLPGRISVKVSAEGAEIESNISTSVLTFVF